MDRLNSVTLDKNRCLGCTTCMKHCPTEAIRVRRGRAHILQERCIDCGNCIRVCPHRAKKAVCDSFDRLQEFKWTVALPAPSLYGQFHNLSDANIVLSGLKEIGFSDVYEVSRAAEQVSDLTRKRIKEGNLPRPYISSACPVSTRLIRMRFPQLIPNISEFIEPVEYAAIQARAEAVEKTGFKPCEIGIFFITPCPAKVTSVHAPSGINERVIDGAISMSDIYKRLLSAMKKNDEPEQLSRSGIVGIGWARSGGEVAALLNEGYLAVDGIDNIIKILEDIDAGLLPEVEFLELNACGQGCVGGCITIENPYVAKGRIKHLMRYLPVSRNKAADDMADKSKIEFPREELQVGRLDEDRTAAFAKFAKISALALEFPGLDCGSCGAPSCRALAEDIVLGFASEEDCIFRMRERMEYMTGGSDDADAYLPPPFRKVSESSEEREN